MEYYAAKKKSKYKQTQTKQKAPGKVFGLVPQNCTLTDDGCRRACVHREGQ